MRPIQLTLTAFGPYKNVEVIDFTKLGEHRLFVVAGNTGAGKTTIFDAICYALYGSASGEDRAEFRTLRSQFADEATHTSVEMLFVVKNKRYRVFRQMKHRKGSNKSETGDKLELYEILPNGEEVPAVERFVIKDVDNKLVELIGLSKDQFSQIVMLPQGEFRKLLTSSTDNKEAILRKIFQTERFERLEQLAGAKYKALHEQIKEQLFVQRSLLEQIKDMFTLREGSMLYEVLSQEQFNSFQVINALKEEHLYLEQYKSRLDLQKQEQAERLSMQRKGLMEQEQLNGQIERYELLLKQLDALLAKADEQSLIKQEVQLAEKAREVEPFMQVKQAANKALIERELDMQAKQLQLESASAALQQKVKQLEIEQARSEQRKQLAIQVHELEQLLPISLELKHNKQKLQRLSQQLEQQNLSLIAQEGQLKQLKEQRQQLQVIIAQSEKAGLQFAEANNKQEQVAREGKLIKRIIEQMEQYEQARMQLLAVKQQRDSSKQAFAQLEEQWLNGQAAMLAVHLHDGEACPVCGSLEHPHKQTSVKEIPTKEQLEQEKSRMEQAVQQYLMQEASLLTAKSSIADWLAEINNKELSAQLEKLEQSDYMKHLSFLKMEQDDLREQWKQLKIELEQLKEAKEQHEKVKQELVTTEQQLEILEASVNSKQRQYQEDKVQEATLKAKLLEMEQRIPQQLQETESLETHFNQQKQLLHQLELYFQQAESEWQQAEKTFTLAQTYASQAQHEAAEAKEHLKLAAAKLQEQLSLAEFEDEQHLNIAIRSKQQLEELKLAIQKHDEELTKTKHELDMLRTAINGKAKQDTNHIRNVIMQLEEQFEQLLSEEALVAGKIQELHKMSEKLSQLSKQLEQFEQQLAVLADLFQMMKGDNALKLSFERYILIDYLEQILIMANIRLKLLSNGQFELIRSDRLESNGKQSGLGLDVYDSYTGQNRDVKSLSGGEKFNASLCLALGMTDVIQSSQGGVSIEMMFIDEGFGSLDEESLQKAIVTLVDLQRAGRMIGVISHVQELKDALPACLEVSKTKDGYSQTKFIIKA